MASVLALVMQALSLLLAGRANAGNEQATLGRATMLRTGVVCRTEATLRIKHGKILAALRSPAQKFGNSAPDGFFVVRARSIPRMVIQGAPSVNLWMHHLDALGSRRCIHADLEVTAQKDQCEPLNKLAAFFGGVFAISNRQALEGYLHIGPLLLLKQYFAGLRQR
jgi:hypothetical protein